MAELGTAYVVVRALTNKVEDDIRKGFSGADRVSQDAGKRSADGFRKGWKSRDLGITDLERDAEKARLTLRRLTLVNYFLTPAIIGVVGAIGALGAGLAILSTVLSRAIQSSVALGSALSAVLQTAVVVKVGMGGVAEAFKALKKQEDEAAKSSDRIAAALKRVEQARIRLRNIIDKEAPEKLAEARERAAEAERGAANALLSSQRATRTYNDAQKETLEALEDLNKARDRAREKIQQLRFEVEGAAISERRARLSFERARDSLQRVQDLPPNSRARQEAELAFAEADLNLRKAIDRNSDLKKEEEAATRAGVEGSQEVVNAKARIERATIAEKDAQIAAANAQLDVARARREADKAAAAAAEGGSVQREIDAQIASARESLKQAQKDLADAQKGAGAGVEDAFKDVSPAVEEFLRKLMSLEDEFKKIRFATQEGLFPGLTRSLDVVAGRIDELTPMFNKTGSVIGEVAEGFVSNAFEGENFSKLQGVWSTNDKLIGNFGRSLTNLYTTLLNILTAARPLAERFGAWIETLTGRWAENTGNNIDGLTERFNKAGDVAADLGEIFSNLNRFFRGLGDAIEESGALEDFIQYMKDSTEAWADFAEAGGDSEFDLVDYFAQANTNVQLVLTAISTLGKEILGLGGEESTGDFAAAVDEALQNFGEMFRIIGDGEGGFSEFIVSISELFLALAENESFGAFFNILNDVIDSLKEFIEIPFVKENLDKIFVFFAMAKAIGVVTRLSKFFGLAVLGNIFKPFQMVEKAVNRSANGLGFFKVLGMRLRTFAQSLGIVIRRFATRISRVFTVVRKALGSIVRGLFKFLGSIAKFFGKLLFMVGKALLALGKLLLANPFILLIVAIVAIVVLVIKYWDEIVAYVQKAVDWIREKVGAAWDKIKEKTKEFIQKVAEFIVNLWDKVKEWFNKIKDFILEYHPFAVLWRAVRDAWPKIRDWVKEKIDSIVNFFSGIKDRVREKVSGMWDGIKDGFRSALNWLITKWNNFGLSLRFPDWLPFGLANKEVTFDTPNIPLLAKGGIVPAVPGGTLARIGEAGQAERIEPLDSDGLSNRDKAMIKFLTSTAPGGGGTVVNVYPAPGMNERELADLVSRRLAKSMRAGAV